MDEYIQVNNILFIIYEMVIKKRLNYTQLDMIKIPQFFTYI